MAAKRPIKIRSGIFASSKPAPRQTACLETTDSTIFRQPATFLDSVGMTRDWQPQLARLANQFIRQNQGILNQFGVIAEMAYDGSNVDLIFRTSTRIGALPLVSPKSGRPDFGLVIQPRFGWQGIGPMLSEMGWRIVPQPLRLPMLPRSDRKIPAWVLSTIVLLRLRALLDRLERRFEFSEADCPAPRGSVRWNEYATERLPFARFLNVPCRFPDLRDDQELKAAIHFTLRRQLLSLDGQRQAGILVLRLIELCLTLLQRVRQVSPKEPGRRRIESWQRGLLKQEVFLSGVQAIEWTIEGNGLAGLSDLQGLPWIMSMEEFFEAWVETIFARIARHSGGQLRTGRKRETISPIIWNPSYVGSQKYLLPDLVLERESETLIVDAKFKGHWEELQRGRWGELDDALREHHRADLLQVLAYSAVSTSQTISSCLIYPCTLPTWEFLKREGRVVHRGSLRAGSRNIGLLLAAVPMVARLDEVATELEKSIFGGRE
jgi:McrBC 5-methylcytosine restriction system component